jgi:hypothetical protein
LGAPPGGGSGGAAAPLEWAGGPRDLGAAQGRSFRSALQGAFAGAPWRDRLRQRAGLRSGRAARVARDLRRHFPHRAEAAEALARSARVPEAWLAETLAAGLARSACPLPARAAARAGRAGAPALLAARFAGSLAPLALRRSRPDGRLASLEVALAWLPAALAGVNERGLAVCGVPGPPCPGPCAAPAVLLVQDCLERFESLAAALDWCLRRPAGGRAAILLADAAGEVAGVAFSGVVRRRLRPAQGGLVETGDAARDARIAAALGAAPGPDAAQLLRALAPEPEPPGGAGRLVLDPAGRRLGLLAAGALSWLAL